MNRWLIALVFICTFVNAGSNRLRIVELKHSLAAPVADMIKPHLSAGAGISTHENKLLLNISDEEFARIEPIINQLDAAPIRLMVSVRQVSSDKRVDKDLSADVTLSNQGSDVKLKGRYQTNRDEQNAAQRVQTLSGSAAFLQTGYDIPYLTATYSPLTGTINVGTQFRAVGTGFYVLPRVSGNEVTLLINPQQETAQHNGQIRSNVMETQISGQLGQWMELGSSTQDQHDYQTQNRQAWRVELKVDLIP